MAKGVYHVSQGYEPDPASPSGGIKQDAKHGCGRIERDSERACGHARTSRQPTQSQPLHATKRTGHGSNTGSNNTETVG